jgi:hypothetical protein
MLLPERVEALQHYDVVAEQKRHYSKMGQKEPKKFHLDIIELHLLSHQYLNEYTQAIDSIKNGMLCLSYA